MEIRNAYHGGGQLTTKGKESVVRLRENSGRELSERAAGGREKKENFGGERRQYSLAEKYALGVCNRVDNNIYN